MMCWNGTLNGEGSGSYGS